MKKINKNDTGADMKNLTCEILLKQECMNRMHRIYINGDKLTYSYIDRLQVRKRRVIRLSTHRIQVFVNSLNEFLNEDAPNHNLHCEDWIFYIVGDLDGKSFEKRGLASDILTKLFEIVFKLSGLRIAA